MNELSQYACKTFHNTETMMLTLTDEALRGFDDNITKVVIFLDLTRSHQISIK